ncbi:MAG: PAS domain S-box protein [Pseudomonadota bacterium]
MALNATRRLDALPAPRLRLFAVATLLLTLLAVGAYVWRQDADSRRLREATLRHGEEHAAQVAEALAEQTAATMLTIDSAVRHLRDESAEGHEIDSDVRTIYDTFPPNTVAQIGIIGADGYLAWSSVGTTRRIYLGDRVHFKAHLDTEADNLYISAPVLGRASGAWSIQFSRAIRRQGRFAGVMVVSLSPDYFARAFAALKLDPDDVIALFKPDGTYLARVPKQAEAMGRAVPATRPFVGEKIPARGTFRTEAAFDKVERLFAWRRLDAYPVSVVVGLSRSALLRPVEEEIAASWRRAKIASLLVLLLAVGMAALLLRAARLQQALIASEIRHRGIFEKNTSVHLLIDPADGRIVDANQAAADFYGYARETLLTMRITDINSLPPAEVKAEMQKAKDEQRLYFNFRHRLADGTLRDVEVYSGPVEIEGRTLLFSIIHDVTARHELERRLTASEELHRSLFLTIAEGVIVVCGNGRITTWNDAALRILGVNAEALQSRKPVVVGADGEPLALEDYPTMRAARGEAFDHALYGVIRPDGKRVWVTVNCRPLQSGNAGGCAVLSFSDITELVEAEESLRLAQSVFEVAGEGIIVTDADNLIIAVNPAFSQLTGYAAEEVLGKGPGLLASGLHDADFYAAMWQRLTHDGTWEGEISNRRKDGRIFVEWLRITVVPERPGHGRRHVALFSDITERKREAEAIWHQANFDELTGLPNRKLLEDRLKRAIAQAHRKHTRVALLFIDLDRFKPVNDAYGHAAGDDLLQQVARRLENSLRDEDTVARLGGDEFVAVLPDLRTMEAPERAAEKIVGVISAPYRVGTHFVEISCSIGIALFPQDAGDADGLIARADAAMYAAKQAGRSTWRTL